MKYCLLINISRDFISFSYNKEGDKGFVPYGEEPIKPLAVYCQGNEISIGKFALSEAQKGNKYAHSNLFDAMSSTELIEYKGQKHDINKLLFFAMEKYVAEFFDKILMRSEGSLEDNRAHFPVVVLFNPNLRFHERDYVVKSLLGGGYGNLWVINASDIFERVACSKMDTGTIPVFVGGDGYNLYCESKRAKLSEIVTMEKVAMDPRIDRAMTIMWADILHQGYDEYRSDRDCDVKVLRKCTTDFLKSFKREQMTSVVLSDGQSYDLFLKLSDFGMSSSNTSEEAMVAFSKLKELLELSGTKASQCIIVLTDREVVTEYVENLFRHYFPNVIGINDEQRYNALQILAEMVASMNYKFPTSSQTATASEADKAFVIGKFKEARELYKSMNSAAAEGRIDDCTSCIKDERRIREFLSLPIEAQRREKDDVLNIFSKWAKLGVGDDYINLQREKLGKQVVQNSPETDTKPEQPDSPKEQPPKLSPKPLVPPIDVKKVRREYREVTAQAKGFIREGKTAEAKKELMAFVAKYKDKDVDIHEAEQLLSEIGGDEPSEGDCLMKDLKFKEARAWFAENGFTSKATDCSKLIKAVRSLKAYKAEITSIKNNHNIQLAKSHLDDMKGWRTIYVRYGLDTKEIDDIINNYKSIK
jgi:hypothetical protein